MFTQEFEKKAVSNSTLWHLLRNGVKNRAGISEKQKLPEQVRDKIHNISTLYSLRSLKGHPVHAAIEKLKDLEKEFPKKKNGAA